MSPDYERRVGAASPVEKKDRVSLDDYERDQSPSPNPDAMDSPGYGGAESPPAERYRR